MIGGRLVRLAVTVSAARWLVRVIVSWTNRRTLEWVCRVPFECITYAKKHAVSCVPNGTRLACSAAFRVTRFPRIKQSVAL